MQECGNLYIIATPIGNLADITQRALSQLAGVNVICAEDTRHSQHLLNHYGIKTPLLSLHQHNEKSRIPQLLSRLQQGESVALISDAGTPLISDPGQHLVAECHSAGIPVVPIPGASALITALSASGLSADQFVFLGFLPSKAKQRQDVLQNLCNETRTMVCYEAPHRMLDLIADLISTFGTEHQAVIAKELTKSHETIYSASLTELQSWLQADPKRQRGEFVVLIKGQMPRPQQDLSDEARRVLNVLLQELPVKQAAKLAAAITGEKKNRLYEAALK